MYGICIAFKLCLDLFKSWLLFGKKNLVGEMNEGDVIGGYMIGES